MKKYFCLILFLFTSITFSQKFEFDFVTTYEMPTKDFRKRTVYSSSANPNHLLSIYDSKSKNRAYLHDLENKKYYIFKIIRNKENAEEKLSFKYKKTKKVNQSYYERFQYDKAMFKVIKKEGDFTTVLITYFSDYNAMIKEYLTEIKIKESNQNYFPNFRMAMLHPMELLMNFDWFKNGLVVESVQIRDGERVYPSKLVYSEVVELELVVPN
jgi:hypothetical protein